MHGCDSATHEDAAEHSSDHSHLAPAYDKQGNGGRDNRGYQRQQDRGPVVLHRDRQAEGQHPDVVHGPNTETHRYGPAVQPEEAGLSLGGSDPSGEAECGIRREDRDQDRKSDKTVIVSAYKFQIRRSHSWAFAQMAYVD